MITIEEVMTTDVFTLSGDDSIANAREQMYLKNVRHIPIVNDNNTLLGLVSHRDILESARSKLEAIEADQHAYFETTIPLREIMKTELSTIHKNESLRNAAMRLEASKHGCLPVVTGEKLVGIITSSDFVGVAINLLEQIEMTEPVELTAID